VKLQYNVAARKQQAVRRHIPAHVWGVLLGYIERKRRELAAIDPTSPRIRPTVATSFDASVWR
jgi:hypothetical protein